MTRKEAIIDIRDNIKPIVGGKSLDMAIEALEQEPCEDAISRQAVLNCLTATGLKKYDFILNARDKIKNLPSVKPQEPFDIETYCKEHFCVMIDRDVWEKAEKALEQEPKTEQFAKWVATEIFDDYWEYNADAFAEIACRKLAKLGIVTEVGNEWELVEPQESEG